MFIAWMLCNSFNLYKQQILNIHLKNTVVPALKTITKLMLLFPEEGKGSNFFCCIDNFNLHWPPYWPNHSQSIWGIL